MRARIAWLAMSATPLMVISLTWVTLAVTSMGCRSGSSESPSEKTASSDEASDEEDLPDDWWEEDEEGEEGEGEGEEGEGEGGEGEEDWEDDGDGEEGSFWYGYVEDGSAEETTGEVGWVDEGCEWYAEVSGVATELCSDCSATFIMSVGAAYIEEDGGCDGSIEDLTEQDFTIGFNGAEALVYQGGSWEAFAEAFYEGSAIGWYSEL